jgi:hypothetical protein
MAVLAASVFILVASYKIELPGLYFDEMLFADAAQGNFNFAKVHIHVGPIPIMVMPYIGALKAWIYTPIFRLLGVSALTARLPVILIAAATLLILFAGMRPTLRGAWAATVVWLLALDPANIFPSRLDWGPTVLMHFFQACMLALWFSYRNSPQWWKLGLISICCLLGFFDKFNFIWFVTAFAIATPICYPDSVKRLWDTSSILVRWVAIIVGLAALAIALRLILPIMQFPSAESLRPHLMQSWSEFQISLSGAAVAELVFGSSAGILQLLPHKLVVSAACLALACWAVPMSNGNAAENRRNGSFCLLIVFFVFAQIVITPQAGGPHHHSMLFPLPILACGFFVRSLYEQMRIVEIRVLSTATPILAAAAALCLFLVNIHNSLAYLTHFQTDPRYMPLWSPAIYSLSDYINDHGREFQKIISVDCCMEQLRPMAPSKVRRRFRDVWLVFKEAPKNPEQEQSFIDIFPNGKTLVLTFAASKETFPETEKNFLDFVSAQSQLTSRLVKEFWYGSDKIYEVYEVIRQPRGRKEVDEKQRSG